MLSLAIVLINWGLLLLQPPTALARLPEQATSRTVGSSLFAQDDIVELTLSLPLNDVLSDRGDSPQPHPAVLTYRDAAAATQQLAVQVQVRGNHRKNPAVCGFPPLMVRFSPADSRQDALFGDMTKLKLVTHCLDDTHTLREYFIYKLYNQLTDLSYRVRLCRVTYRDTRSKSRPATRYAFFLEDTKAMALRNQATKVSTAFFIGMESMDARATATMAVFQYMIGNTDWSVPYRHNIRLMTLNPRTPCVPVPYDFDYSGLVMPPYAVPPEQLGIRSVRERLYRGLDFSPAIYAEVRDLFNARRPAFYNVYLSCRYLDTDEKNFATRYLDDFYETLNDPKDFERRITRVGSKNAKRRMHIIGLD